MPEHLHARVEACYQQAETFFNRRFPRPEVSFKLRGQKAGVAHLSENKLRFNPTLYQQNREDFLRQTVAHEVAHMIAHYQFGARIQPHGQEWQLIMQGVYELPAHRCHNYALEPSSRLSFTYQCQCADNNQFPFSPQRHRLVKQGRRYFCRRCKATLIYTGSNTPSTR